MIQELLENEANTLPENSRLFILIILKMDEIIDRVRNYVTPIYQRMGLSYHNIVHVEHVVTLVESLGKKENIKKTDRKLLKIAALLHDVAYDSNPDGHEQRSADIAVELLQKEELNPEYIDKVRRLVLSTQMDHFPTDKMEMVIKDADLAHLGSVDFFASNERLYEEMNSYRAISRSEWLVMNIDFLNKHEYYTSTAQGLLNKQKQVNLKYLLKQQKEQQKVQSSDAPDRGVETMFRVALRNHNALSQIADNKANIMLSVTTIMLSLILSGLIPKLDSNEILLYPTILTVIVCLITMYFAVMATRPKVNAAPSYSRELVTQNKTNLLFFGNFQDLDLDEYEWGIEQMMKDRNLLYGALTKDLFFLGKVLSRKYKFLERCYNVFMIGLIVSTLSFIAVMFI